MTGIPGAAIHWLRSHHFGTCPGCREGSCNSTHHCPCEGCACVSESSDALPGDDRG